jgi:hypothetical protein
MIADLLQLLRITPHPASDPIAVASTNGAIDGALSVAVGETPDIKYIFDMQFIFLRSDAMTMLRML